MEEKIDIYTKIVRCWSDVAAIIGPVEFSSVLMLLVVELHSESELNNTPHKWQLGASLSGTQYDGLAASLIKSEIFFMSSIAVQLQSCTTTQSRN